VKAYSADASQFSSTLSYDLGVRARTVKASRGDFNGDGVSADAGDLAMMIDAAVGKYIPDLKYDLNINTIFADAGDLAMMKDAFEHKIELL